LILGAVVGAYLASLTNNFDGWEAKNVVVPPIMVGVGAVSFSLVAMAAGVVVSLIRRS